MKHLILIALCLAFAPISAIYAQEKSQDITPVLGLWQAEKEIDGNKAHYIMKFKKDSKMEFWLQGAENGMTYLYATGTFSLASAGPFTTLKLDKVSMAQTEDPDQLQPSEFKITYILRTGYRKLYLAANFDEDREGQEPEVYVYKKQTEKKKK